MNRFVTSAAAVVLSVVVIGCSGSAPAAPSSAQGVMIGGRLFAVDHGPFSGRDSNFITVSSRMHQAFAQIGRVAENRATHPGVKLFAQQMMQENTLRLSMLRQAVPGAVSQDVAIEPAHQDLLNRISTTSGSEADRAFTQGFMPELEAMLALFRQQASSGNSEVLRELAADFVDRLNTYVEELRELTNRAR